MMQSTVEAMKRMTAEELADARAVVMASPSCGLKAVAMALLAERDSLAKEVSIDNELLADRDRVLDALECPTHGRCIPGALEQIGKMRAELAAALSNVDDLRKALKNSVDAREAFATLFRVENAAHERTMKERYALDYEVVGLRAELAAAKGEK